MSSAYYESGHKEFYCCSTTRKNHALSCGAHLHYEIELIMLTKGRTRIIVDSKEYILNAGDAAIVFPNQVHTYFTEEKEEFALIIFKPELVSDLFSNIVCAVPESAVLQGGANAADTVPLFNDIVKTYYSKEPLRDAVLHGLILALFAKLLQRIELTEAKNDDYHIIGSIMDYCNNHYTEQISLDVLASELHLNKYYISHVISEKLNISFTNYINSLRVSRACNLLSSSDLSMTEISEQSGFNTLRTFNRAFIKHMGCSPTEYRKLKRAQ